MDGWMKGWFEGGDSEVMGWMDVYNFLTRREEGRLTTGFTTRVGTDTQGQRQVHIGATLLDREHQS